MSNSKETSKLPNPIDLVVDDFVSPYGLAKLESEMRGHSIPPQKLYGYVRQGYLKASINSTGKMQIDRKNQLSYLIKQQKNK